MKNIRKFLEWLYTFDFIKGDFAYAMFYYLHPKEFVDEVIKAEFSELESKITKIS